MADNKINVGGRLHSIATGNILAGADEILDDDKGKKQSEINVDIDNALADRYTKDETYNKNELNSLITTPNVQYVTVSTYSQLPATGSADTIYKVSSYDGTAIDATKYAEYAWNGSGYVLLSVKSAVDEIFDISVFNAESSIAKKYGTLTAALADIPSNRHTGGMSIKFIQSSDNRYVQYRLTASEWSIDTNDWIIDEGVYVENLEFVRVVTDNEDKILYGVKSNGEFYFGAGCPQQVKDYVQTQIDILIGQDDITEKIDTINEMIAFFEGIRHDETLQNLLINKVDKEEDKALIPTQYIGEIDNVEYVYIMVDSKGKILFAIKVDGEPYFGVECPQQIKDYIQNKISELSLDEYEDIVAFLDSFIGENRPTLAALLSGKVDKEEGKGIVVTQYVQEDNNPIYIKVVTDSENKILEGITSEGRKEINIPVDTPVASTDYANNPEFIEVTIDKDGRLIEGIDKNGNKVYGKIPAQILEHIRNVGDFENNIWKDKKLTWFGTSIPEGGYPQIVGQILHAEVHNEAVGSSSASGGDANFYQGESWNYAMRAMGSTIYEKMQLFYSIYNVNDSNQTVTWGGNAYGITSLPYSQSSLPSYAKAIQLRKEVLMYSYEIKLISRYLDESGAYLESVMNSADMTALGLSYIILHDSDMDFVCHPDAFVIDHGANDYTTITGSTDSRNRNTFYGAINTFIDNIYLYSPRTSIFIVGDYNCPRNIDNIIINAQIALSDLWQLPMLKVKEKLPFGAIPVTTRGYWDAGGSSSVGNSAGRWHDEGFSFTVNGSSWTSNNDMFYSLDRTKTAAQIVEKYNIRTVNGVQLYDIPQRNMYFKDGLHPSSDISKHSIKMYANVLSELIKCLTY